VSSDPLHPTVELETPDHVTVSFALAGLGRRALATALDILVQVGLTVIVALVAAGAILLWQGGLGDVGGGVLAVTIVALFLVWSLYFIYCELAMNGQTVGKRKLGIRVIKANGSSVDFLSSAIRNLLRWVDWFPMLYGVGTLVTLLSPRYQRLGDLAAGTYVVVQDRDEMPAHVLVDLATLPLPESLKDAVRASVTAVGQDEYEYVLRLLRRLPELSPARPDIAQHLCWQTANALAARMRVTLDRPSDYDFCYYFLHAVATVYAQRSVGA
jgi:uncharacterized RDD family membrane protein YckC